jgi:hypothetical protein
MLGVAAESALLHDRFDREHNLGGGMLLEI